MTSPQVSDPPAEAPAASDQAALRGEISTLAALFWGTTCVAAVLAVWFLATSGEGEDRFISPAMVPSPVETARAIPQVFGERKLLANTLVTLKRVCFGFGLSALVGCRWGSWQPVFPRCGRLWRR